MSKIPLITKMLTLREKNDWNVHNLTIIYNYFFETTINL